MSSNLFDCFRSQHRPFLTRYLKDFESVYGDRGVAAIVLHTAYNNFQDRLLLGMGVPIEENGPAAPLNVRFVEGAVQVKPLIPSENGVDRSNEQGKAVTHGDRQWTSLTFEELQSRLQSQRKRVPRLRVPSWDEIANRLPPAMAASPTSIRWSLMNYGYAPDLAIAWTRATRTHWAEYPSNRILEESLFWVQTRALECNYCMGHCEMLLELAG